MFVWFVVICLLECDLAGVCLVFLRLVSWCVVVLFGVWLVCSGLYGLCWLVFDLRFIYCLVVYVWVYIGSMVNSVGLFELF